MKFILVVFLAILMTVTLSVSTFAASKDDDDGRTKPVKEEFKDIGRAFKKGGRAVGHIFKKGAKAVGKALDSADDAPAKKK